jgi:hypothetical protein
MLQKQEEITNSPYTDWIPSFDIVLNKQKLAILELGFGEGTKYLLDNFKSVISIDFSRYEYLSTELPETHALTVLPHTPETVEKDNVLIETAGEVRPDFTEEVESIIKEVDKYKADFVFVDFGFHFRSEVVQELIALKKYKYIAYHDTADTYYGYENLDLSGYKVLVAETKGRGTTILQKKR